MTNGIEDMDEREINALLEEMGQDTVPLGHDLRARLIADAPSKPRRVRWWHRIGRSGWGGALGVPVAALCGLWIGGAQPNLVLQIVPGISLSFDAEAEDGIFDDIYGNSLEDWL